MKFLPGFEVQFLRPGAGAAYADLTHGADRYVVGVADQPFEVRCSAPSSQFKSPIIRVTLQVDGASVGVCKLLTPEHPSASFNGFVTTCKGQSTTRQFLFGKPETEFGDSSSAAGSKQAGSIEVSFTAVREVPGYVPTPTTTAALQAAAASNPMEGEDADKASCASLRTCIHRCTAL